MMEAFLEEGHGEGAWGTVGQGEERGRGERERRGGAEESAGKVGVTGVAE